MCAKALMRSGPFYPLEPIRRDWSCALELASHLVSDRLTPGIRIPISQPFPHFLLFIFSPAFPSHFNHCQPPAGLSIIPLL